MKAVKRSAGTPPSRLDEPRSSDKDDLDRLVDQLDEMEL